MCWVDDNFPGMSPSWNISLQDNAGLLEVKILRFSSFWKYSTTIHKRFAGEFYVAFTPFIIAISVLPLKKPCPCLCFTLNTQTIIFVLFRIQKRNNRTLLRLVNKLEQTSPRWESLKCFTRFPSIKVIKCSNYIMRLLFVTAFCIN